MANVFPADPMADLKVWITDHPDLAPLHDGHVFLRLPPKVQELGAPVLRLYQTNLTNQPETDTPLLTWRVGIEVWGFGDGTSGASDWPKVRQMAMLLASALQQVLGPTLLNPEGETLALSADVMSFPESPDPDLGWPRMVADAVLFVRSLSS